MHRALVIALLCWGAGHDAAGQENTRTSDVLGAHLNYGRGCAACHTPHSGSDGNGKTADSSWGVTPLWGADESGQAAQAVPAARTSGHVLETGAPADPPDVAGMLACLGCHDGNYAIKAMMNDRAYEMLPSSYGLAATFTTLLDGAGLSGFYLEYHPAGLTARIGCGAANWDCTESGGVVRMDGRESSQFVTNYGFFMKLATYNNFAVIVCTTCHDPHSMNRVRIGKENSGIPAGTYATTFFLRAPYNPTASNPLSNQSAQFCRQCHAELSNEMNGSSATTVF